MSQAYLSLLIAILFSASVHSQEKSLKLATTNWPPYTIEKGDRHGFAYDILKKAFESEGYKLEITFLPWTRVMKEVKLGKNYQAGFPAYYSKARETDFNFSDSYLDGPVVFAKRKGSPLQYTTIEALKPLQIGVVRGYINEKNFDAADFLQKQPTVDDKQNIRKLIKKRVDLVVIDKFTAGHILKNMGNKDKVEFIEKALDFKSLHILFAKSFDKKKAHTDFMKGLEKLKKSGEYQKIIDSYM